MTLVDLETRIMERVRGDYDRAVGKADVAATLKALAVLTRDVLEDGGDIYLPGIGLLKMCNRAARKGRNPRTGEVIDIPARKQVTFTASGSLIEALGGK